MNEVHLKMSMGNFYFIYKCFDYFIKKKNGGGKNEGAENKINSKEAKKS